MEIYQKLEALMNQKQYKEAAEYCAKSEKESSSP